MHFPLKTVLKNRLVVFLMAGCFGITVMAARKQHWFFPASVASAVAQQPVGGGQKRPPVDFRQSVRVWVHGSRLSPDLIRIRPGKVLFRIENETLADVSVSVEKNDKDKPKVDKGKIQTDYSARKGKRAEKELDLEPGEYAFFLTDNPQIRGTMIVENK